MHPSVWGWEELRVGFEAPPQRFGLGIGNPIHDSSGGMHDIEGVLEEEEASEEGKGRAAGRGKKEGMFAHE